ncbi:hypothetical protein [Streptomyces yangpuensis]|uniref:hypothetical protein n=1 Tax=Streptomyces yangpuensis TaxID=1648182 RepID=UPI0036B30F87
MPQLTDHSATDHRASDHTASDERERGSGTWMTPEEYGASRAVVWTAAVVLVTDTDGRVLLRIARATGTARLPTPTAATVTGSAPLGYRCGEEGVHVRVAARLAGLPPAADPAYARLLATPEQVRELSDWGPAGEDELAAVHAARVRLGLPAPSRTPLTELPEEGARW